MLATDGARPLSIGMRRKHPVAVAQLDVLDGNSRTERKFYFLSHAFLCTEDTTLAIGSTECDEDTVKDPGTLGLARA